MAVAARIAVVAAVVMAKAKVIVRVTVMVIVAVMVMAKVIAAVMVTEMVIAVADITTRTKNILYNISREFFHISLLHNKNNTQTCETLSDIYSPSLHLVKVMAKLWEV